MLDLVKGGAYWRETETVGAEFFYQRKQNLYSLANHLRQTLTCSLLNLKPPSSAWAPDIPLLFTFHLEQTGQNTIQNQKWKQNIWSLEYRLFLYCQLSLDLHAFKISLGEDRVSVLLWKWKDLSPDSPGPTSRPLPGWAASCRDGSPPWTCFGSTGYKQVVFKLVAALRIIWKSEPQAASQTSNLNPRNWPYLQRLVLGSWDLHYRHQWTLLSCIWLFVTPRTIARQAPLSMEFSKQEYWSGLPFHQWGLHWCSACSSQITSSASYTLACCGDTPSTQQLWCQQRQTRNSWV